MNCPNCGASNLETSSICVNCGRPLIVGGTPQAPVAQSYTPPPPPPPHSYSPPGTFGAPAAPYEPIPNYLVQSIIVTLCCCMPMGVVAIIFAAQVNSKLAAGDIAGARDASSKAKLFCWIAVGLGIAAAVVGALVNGAAILSQMGR